MAENEEEKGFVVKDRRRFAEGSAEEPQSEEPQTGAQPDSDQDEPEQGPLPEVSMATFVFSLSSSALVHLGEIPEPETNQTRVDLVIAKQIIDTLGMLQEKTKGNLDSDEENLLRSVLYDLRMRYVQKSGK
ncbi:MAG: DUF1844 domain-containing protein [Syntrophobacteraceae bacterium]